MAELLTISDIARMTRLSPSTVRRIKSLPPPSQITPGGFKRWEPGVIDVWLADGFVRESGGIPAPPCPNRNGHTIVQRHKASTETPPERLDRLRAAAGLSQHALCVQLGISRGALQRATRKGEVPPEVEAWMQAREGGGR